MAFTHRWEFFVGAVFSDAEWSQLLALMAEARSRRLPSTRFGTSPVRRTESIQGEQGFEVASTVIAYLSTETETLWIAQRPSAVFPVDSDAPTFYQSIEVNSLQDLVVAILCLIHHQFPGKLAKVALDGEESDWMGGLALARELSGNPQLPLPPRPALDASS